MTKQSVTGKCSGTGLPGFETYLSPLAAAAKLLQSCPTLCDPLLALYLIVKKVNFSVPQFPHLLSGDKC